MLVWLEYYSVEKSVNSVGVSEYTEREVTWLDSMHIFLAVPL